MERRHFLQKGALAGAAWAAGSMISKAADRTAADKPFNLNYAFHDGMFANHAGKDFVDQIKYAYDKGFRSIEDNGMMSRTVAEQERIGRTLSDLGMQMGVFVVTSDSWHWKTSLATGKPEWKDRMVRDCKEAVEVAKRCGAKWVTVVPGNFDRSQTLEHQTAHVVDALRRGADILAPKGMVMVLEPLSDNPDLFLRYSDQTYTICKAVNSPACKILFDMYHMQRNEGDIINHINRNWEEIAYFQIGDNPGRNEPNTGEMNYRNIFKHIYDKGYRGILGMEHGLSLKGKEGELALIQAYRTADAFR